MGFGDWFADSIASPVYHGFGEAKDWLVDKGGDAWGDLTGATAAKHAAEAQMSAADKDIAFRQRIYDDQKKQNEPWMQAGVSALSDLSGGIKSGAFDTPVEQFNDPGAYKDPGFKFNFEADPGYAFRQQQQQQAIERSAAAGGGLFSGATLSDLAKRSGQMASDEFGNAYARQRGAYENDRSFGQASSQGDRATRYGIFSDNQNRLRQKSSDRFDRLSTLAGFGNAGANRGQQNSSAFGDSVSNSILGRGNAQAAGMVGAANANTQGIMGLAGLAAKIYGAV